MAGTGVDTRIPGALHYRIYVCGSVLAGDAAAGSKGEPEADCGVYEGKKALIFVGLPWEKDGKLYNVAAVICDGHLLGLVPKRYLPNYNEF